MGEVSPNTAPQAHPAKSAVSGQTQQDTSQSGSDNKFYEQVQKCIEDMAIHLKPLVENSSDDDSTTDSKRDSSPSMRVCTSDTGNSDKCKEIALSDADVHQEHSTNTSKNTVLNKIANSMTKLSRNDHIKSAKNMKRGTKGNMYVEDRSIKSASSPSRELQQEKCVLSRPMQRKLLSLLQCDMLEEEGQSRSARIARSLGERVVSELLVLQQFPHQLSSNLWAAVRTRGCQFLGPAMQEEVLKLILLALEDGSPLSRKVLVLFVVQKLEVRYPQASKTAIGHVVQLLYRASCFKVQKRDGESSLMQLKEEFRLYEALRREHDSQIVQIALEAGLRISPEQWSSLLYGDVAHKPHMQSIIDKHQSPQSFSQNIAELMEILQQRNPPAGSLLRLKPHLEFLSNIDPSPGKG
ncbi:roquin-1-like [Plakobranchus ocellatus]|uniref:RING-type E3 ubiquitin transferase n=1 Tax=Plakobranchus ocellatus TaxID=259542 RepID=A0AAV3YS12_9GAST|nr:roquin-1-like [Plakobranchus ocellatus]